jgi:N-acetylmuramoyl-L-alanine amidase
MMQTSPAPPPSTATDHDRDRDILARTLHGEARGEGRAGLIAVASVILNRQRIVRMHPARIRQFGGPAIADICLAPAQFSCWLASDPNSAILRAPTITGQSFILCTRIAADALAGRLNDPTGGADHYCVARIAPQTFWARGKTSTAIIGAHAFYRLET